MITIVISTYNNVPFFKELLTSIDNQTYKDFRILIGIDGSTSDKQWLTYNPGNYEVTSFTDNKGPYITFNTLVEKIDTPYILFFGADDVMHPELLEKISKKMIDVDIVRFGFIQFGTITNSNILYPACGAFLIKTDLFREMNGFYDWKCAADAEFMYRALAKGARQIVIKEPLFKYRRHPKCLTINSATSMTSPFRQKYTKLIRENRRNNIWKNPDSYIIRTDIDNV